VNDVLAIAGYADVKLAIDGKQPTLTGSSNITTGTINASNVTASGILNIAGYSNVKPAIDGKQPTLTGSSNITTGTINASNVTASGIPESPDTPCQNRYRWEATYAHRFKQHHDG
jgi:hypothetical protein